MAPRVVTRGEITAMQTITWIVLALSLTGQITSDAWKDLRQYVGVTVLVRDTHGVETSGRLIDVTVSALTISVDADTQSILKTDTCDVSLIRRDRSAAVGWIVGFTLGGLAAGIIASKVREGARPALFVVAGAGLGTLIGMTGTQRHPLYRRVARSGVCHS